MTTIPPAADAAELARLGITRVSTERFHVGPYRYANLADAIAEARRGRVAGNDA
jgi:hypothetical protein